MMPITNVFNEWWSAATIKKLRAVRLQNAKNGKNGMSHSPYGYILGTDEKRTLQINEETAPSGKQHGSQRQEKNIDVKRKPNRLCTHSALTDIMKF